MLIERKVKHLVKLLKCYCAKKAISPKDLYQAVNGHNKEMNKDIFKAIVNHMDKEISQYEIDFMFRFFDADNSGNISYNEFINNFADGHVESEMH